MAEEAFIAKLNGAVSRGQLKNKANKLITEPLDGGLIRADRQICIQSEKTFLSCSSKKAFPWKGSSSQTGRQSLSASILGQHVSYQNLPATHA